MHTSHATSGIRTHHPSTCPGHGSHQTAGTLTHSATMFNTSVGYTPVLHVWNMCITSILHIYYRCMNYMCNTPKTPHMNYICITHVIHMWHIWLCMADIQPIMQHCRYTTLKLVAQNVINSEGCLYCGQNDAYISLAVPRGGVVVIITQYLLSRST